MTEVPFSQVIVRIKLADTCKVILTVPACTLTTQAQRKGDLHRPHTQRTWGTCAQASTPSPLPTQSTLQLPRVGRTASPHLRVKGPQLHTPPWQMLRGNYFSWAVRNVVFSHLVSGSLHFNPALIKFP